MLLLSLYIRSQQAERMVEMRAHIKRPGELAFKDGALSSDSESDTELAEHNSVQQNVLHIGITPEGNLEFQVETVSEGSGGSAAGDSADDMQDDNDELNKVSSGSEDADDDDSEEETVTRTVKLKIHYKIPK